jgi:hypothetical protein
VGRYIYGWVRLDPQHLEAAKTLGQSLSELVARVPPEWRQHARDRDPALHHVLALAGGGTAGPRSLAALFLGMPGEALRVRRGLRHARRLFLERPVYRAFRADVQELRRLRARMHLHRRFKRLMSIWRSLHVVLAIVLLALIGMHVWVSLRVGFRWLWS